MKENNELKEFEVTEQSAETNMTEETKPKRVKMNRVRNIALASLLAAGIIGVPYAMAESNGGSADGDGNTDGPDAASASSSAQSASTSDEFSKDETVYAFTKADGSTKNIIVSDWLKNGGKLDALNDTSNLTDITNTEGAQAFTRNGDNLVWAAGGNDIYYQGNSSEETPVTMKITYTLNGQEISADELAGKSGKITIRYSYTNNSYSNQTVNGSTQRVYTPFLVMSGMILDNSKFKNIEVTNGKFVNDGDRTTIAGYALPGLQDDLGIDKDTLDVPDYFEVTADVTNFKLDTTATVVTDSLFTKDTDTSIDASTIEDSLNSMQDAMTQLLDGSNDLTDGINQLSAGTATLADGLTSAKDGTSTLAGASSQVSDGLDQLRNGTDTSGGLVDAINGLGKSDNDNVADNTTLIGGTNVILVGLGTFQSTIDSSLDSAVAGLNQIDTGLQSAIASIGSDGDSATAGTLIGGLNTSIAAETQGSSDATTAYGTIAGVLQSGNNLTDAQKQALQSAMGNLVDNPQNPSSGALYDIGVAKAADNSVLSGLKTLRGGLESADSGIGQMSTQLSNGKTAIDGVFSSQLIPGVQSLKDNLISMRDGGTLSDGRSSTGIQGAVDALGNADTSGTLIYGESSIGGGLGTLFSGLTSAVKGADTLTQGAQTAAAGSATLSDGLRQFDEEGVQAIVNAYNDNVSGLVDRVNATRNAAKAYNTFSGKSAEMTGSVKFIYETDSIG